MMTSQAGTILVLSNSFRRSQAACDLLVEAGYSLMYAPDLTGDARAEWIGQTISGVEGVIVGHDVIGAQAISRASPRLKVVVKQGGGTDNIDIEAATRHEVLVANAAGANSDAVADLTWALMLAVARRLVYAHNLVMSGGWERVFGRELYLKRLGIVGFGDIGQKVAARAVGFSMQLAYYDVIAYPEAEQELNAHCMEFDELLGWADFVTVHVPLNAATRGLIGRRELVLMKNTAYLINISRGGVVDEEALYDALKAGEIAGAGLDVFADEPLHDLRLARLENVVATPHMGAYTDAAVERVSLSVAHTVREVLKGQLPDSVLNPGAFTGSPSILQPRNKELKNHDEY
jgi:D-3-phosphoglycerate dehydrogenase